MQPYYFPYLGYYRLLSLTDIFVFYDCVQFPRRGWVHRNRIETKAGKYQWLTLPLKKQSQTVKIKDLAFLDTYQQRWEARLSGFSSLFRRENNRELSFFIQKLKEKPVDELHDSMKLVCRQLSIPFELIRSSSLEVPEALKGEARIIAICKMLGATEYLNAPGGFHLYNKETFKKHGIKLGFLKPYRGGFQSSLQRLLNQSGESLITELNSDSNSEVLF